MARSPIDNDTPFNMSMLFYYSLSELINKKDSEYIDGNYDGWYKCLKAIYRRIIFKIRDEEKKEFEKLFEAARKDIRNMSNKNISSRAGPVYENAANQKLDKIDTELTLILDKNHMIFPNIQMVGGIDKIIKRYGLDGKNPN